MHKSAILLIGTLDHTNDEWQALSSNFTLLHYCHGGRATFLEKCRNSTFDNVLGLYRSNASTSETGPFDTELIEALPDSVKYICHNGAGYDTIDVVDVRESEGDGAVGAHESQTGRRWWRSDYTNTRAERDT